MARISLLLVLCLVACDAGKKGKAAEKKEAAVKDAGFDHGTFESSIANLREQVKKAPCDKKQALQLGDYLNRSRDFMGADAWVSEFEKACGAWPRLLWVRQHACEQRADHACASKTAAALIDATPSDSDYWWWRGQAEAGLEHYERARADYFQSMANKPTGFPAFRLAQFADKKLKRPCDGALLIQWWIDHGRRTEEEWIDETRTRLYLAGACGKHSGKGKTVIAAPANAPVVRSKVKLDQTTADFIVDEHTGTSVVSAAVAKKMGLTVPDEPKVAVLAAGAVYEGPLVRVKALQVGAARAEEVDLVVGDGLPEDVDGVLGLNVLMQFQVKRTPKAYELSALP